MKWVILIAFTIFALTSLSTEAYATRYECKAKNNVNWKDDALTVTKAGPMVVRFDDETGALWLGENPKEPYTLNIIQKLHIDNSLVAKKEVTAGNYSNLEVLLMKRENGRLYFVFFAGGGEISGSCTVMQ